MYEERAVVSPGVYISFCLILFAIGSCFFVRFFLMPTAYATHTISHIVVLSLYLVGQ